GDQVGGVPGQPGLVGVGRRGGAAVVGLGVRHRQRVPGVRVPRPGGSRAVVLGEGGDVVVGAPGQLGDLALGVGDLDGPAGGVRQVGGGVAVGVGDLGLDLAGDRDGVGDVGGAAEPVGDGLQAPFEGGVDRGGVVGEVGGVAAGVGDGDEFDVLVALG